MAPVKLHRDPATLREQYRAADPFPHVVIDRLFDDADLDAVLREFPSPEAMRWMRFDNAREKKLGFYHELSEISPSIRRFLDAMNGFEMLAFLEQLTGIDGLIPDPYFGGGGLHQIEAGGFLKIHADFNVHPKLKLDRRLNMLIYLNKEWKEEYGGQILNQLRREGAPWFSRRPILRFTAIRIR